MKDQVMAFVPRVTCQAAPVYVHQAGARSRMSWEQVGEALGVAEFAWARGTAWPAPRLSTQRNGRPSSAANSARSGGPAQTAAN
jgi:hypothetical protein